MDGSSEVDLKQKETDSEATQAQEKLRESATERQEDAPESERLRALHLLDFSRRYGVWAAKSGDQLEFRRSDRKDDLVYFRTEMSLEALEQAGSRIKELIAEKQEELTESYGISFSAEGEDVEKQWVPIDDGTFERSEMIKARSPRLDELLGIEAALLKSRPSHLAADGKQTVKFYFLEKPLVSDDHGDTLANLMHADKDGRPAVYFWPGSSSFRPITEYDEEKIGIDLGYSIESLIMHELAHNGQNKLGWRDLPRLVKLVEEVGWQAYEDPETHQTMIIMKRKDGGFLDFNPDQDYWFSCNKVGVPLDENGAEVDSPDKARQFMPEEIKTLALVRPLTDYMDNPHEIQAEAMMLFRLGGKSRARVLKESPLLYRHVKKQDQHEINLAFGLDDVAQPRFIRSPDGSLVENTPENTKALADFERGSGK